MRFIIKSYIIDIFAIIYELLYLLITNRTLFTNFLTTYHFSKLSIIHYLYNEKFLKNSLLNTALKYL